VSVASASAAGSARRRRVDLARPSDRTALVAVATATALALLIWSPFSRGPGDPAAVAGDARLARCGGTVADAEWAFTIPHASAYRAYLPGLIAPELDLAPSALVVIYRGPFPRGVVAAAAATPTPAPTPDPGTRDVCIYVGIAGQGTLNYYSDMPIAGLRATPDGPMLFTSPSP
jgi:hypothetical protein